VIVLREIVKLFLAFFDLFAGNPVAASPEENDANVKGNPNAQMMKERLSG
jgi:hypothetical protein